MSDVLQSFTTDTAVARAPLQARTASPAGTRDVAVLHVFRYFRPDFTGDGLYFEKLMPRLERHGVRNHVIAGVTRAQGGRAAGDVRLFGQGSATAHFNPLMLLWVLFNAWRYDVVHLHSAVDRMFAYHVIARLWGCRVVQSCTLDDGLGSIIEGYRPRYRSLVRHLCRLIDDVVTISPRLYADTIAASPSSRVHLIPQGVSIPHLDTPTPRTATRESLGVGAEDTMLLFVGGICPRKDARFLVENHLAGEHRLHLVLLGPVLDDDYAATLRQAIAQSAAAGRIHLSGYVEDPTPMYRAADVFVFASHKEGCPNVLLEAMAHGLPIVSRRLPGTTDSVVDHGRNGFLFDTAAEYAAAVQHLLDTPDDRQVMGAAAHAAVCSGYEMEGIASRYAALYRRAA